MIHREVCLFLIVGTLSVLVDFSGYQLLLHTQCSHHTAKGISFILGTIFAYFANKLWTFGHHQALHPGSSWRFVILYLLTLGANVGVNSMMLQFFHPIIQYAQTIAFLLATFTSASMNFIGMKFFVFRPKEIA